MKEISASYHKITTLDMHTGGEPLRIIMEGFPQLEPAPILDQRRLMMEKYDHLRKAMMWEPRGHADMYGLIKVPAECEDSAFGVLFIHNEGYSTMCGHATIAIGRAAIELDWIEKTKPITTFCIDAPCGQIKIMVEIINDEVNKISFDNVPSFYIGSYSLATPDYGAVDYDLAYGGAFYAYIRASDVGLSCNPEDYAKLIRCARILKANIINTNSDIKHPFSDDLSFLYGIIFIDDAEDPEVHSRNVCVFADGEVDRCSTGSGISGRAAIHYAKGEIEVGQKMMIESIIGSHLEVEIVNTLTYGPHNAVIPRVSGMAHFTGQHEFWIDPIDPFKNGFLLR